METIGLIVSCILTIGLAIFLSAKKKKNQLQKVFIVDCLLLFLSSILLLAQKYFCANYNTDPIFFEYFVYIFTCLLPVSIFFTGLIFANTKIKFKKKYLLLFVIPIFSLIILWTNNWHHLFYIEYSTNMNNTVTGSYFIVHMLYTYALFAISIFYLLKYSIKNSGIFSKQAGLFILAALVPIAVNALGALNIIPMSIYLTPISFSATIVLCFFAVFRFNFLGATPIALQRIVDRMSDSYIILNDENIITDFNSTLLNTFGFKASDIRNKNLFNVLKSFKKDVIDIDKFEEALYIVKNSPETLYFDKYLSQFNKYFRIEINAIIANQNFLGVLVLFKDTTQHEQDMKTIKDNQSMLMEKERLATLGQMVGGIAHNLKTPIMSIAGAMEGLQDLVNEYEQSVDDPDVTKEDHHAIAKDMREWIEKVNSYDAYMSDIITTVKGQAVNFNDVTTEEFTVEELLKRINILMKHELKNALATLNVNCAVSTDTTLHGNVNSLVQIVNNLISNSIQAYGDVDSSKKIIDLTILKENNNIVISTQDYGCGIPKDVQDKLFKSMVTTKGAGGTGLGLFMSHSTIKGHFNGDMNFTSEVGKGTRFNIILPINN